MPEAFDIVLNALKGAAEPTRLRLLELLTHGELTVSEISAVLKQSQPRISRHLKMLCDAGLLDRFREEHFVYYRVAATGIGHEFSQRLSTLVAREDATLQEDQRHMAAVLAERVKNAISQAPLSASVSLGELHDVLVDELGGEPIGELLDIGTGTGMILRALGANATRAVGVDISTEALRIARSRTHGAGLSHCMFRRGDMYGLPFVDGAFDTVTMDRVIAGAERPDAAIAEAARTLRAGGRLCLIEDFDALTDRIELDAS
ncbi:MAG TPA: metalloregulator ArsR/SmtB family transcription factor, partial [Steroidobacteraceae bacterium]|nr:metalloregulator ArsR/SmtB family transcription factor [Steroidobacteraceae bacterium]